MRRDAQRNRELILAAARAVYAEHGVEAPLDVVARRAGVGNATVYRRFPDRASLIEAVFHDMLDATLERGEEARTADNAWQGLTAYLDYIFAGLALDRGANDLMTTGISGIPSLERLREHHWITVSGLMARAQRDGTMRADIVPEDLLFSLASFGRAVPAMEAVVSGAWRRPLALLLDGLRAEPVRDGRGGGGARDGRGEGAGRDGGAGRVRPALPAEPLSTEEFTQVLRELGADA